MTCDVDDVFWTYISFVEIVLRSFSCFFSNDDRAVFCATTFQKCHITWLLKHSIEKVSNKFLLYYCDFNGMTENDIPRGQTRFLKGQDNEEDTK